MEKARYSDLPRFNYHPSPFSTRAMVDSEDTCDCCGLARGFMYDGPVSARKMSNTSAHGALRMARRPQNGTPNSLTRISATGILKGLSCLARSSKRCCAARRV